MRAADMRTFKAALLLLLAAGCGHEKLDAVHGEIHASPDAVHFGTVWLGYGKTAQLTLSNVSRASAHISVVTAAPVTAPETIDVPAGSTVSVALNAAPDADGDFEGVLHLSADDFAADVPFDGVGKRAPDCAASNDCHSSRFDPDSGSCQETQKPDDSACGGGLTCVENGLCRSGECIGEAKRCDDGNACTLDACVPGQGCVSFDSKDRCEVTTDPCTVGFCDPTTGCGTAPAADGTYCGTHDCVTAHICINAQCVERPVPEGATCGEGICSTAGTCHNGACEGASTSPIEPEWSYHPAFGMNLYDWGVMDDADQLYWAECNDSGGGVRAVCELVSSTSTGFVRYRAMYQSPSTNPSRMLLAHGNVITAFDNGRLEIRRALDGAFVTELSFASLLLPAASPPIGVTDQLSVRDLAADDLGHLYVLVDQYELVNGSVSSHSAWLVAIDDASGTKLWERHAQDEWSLLVDSLGRLELVEVPFPQNGPGSNDAHLLALNASGATVWEVTTNVSASRAQVGGLTVESNGQIRDIATGAQVGGLADVYWPGIFVGRGTTAWGSFEPAMAGDTMPYGSMIARVDLTTGNIQWIAGSGAGVSMDVPAYYLTDALLTDSDALLVPASNGAAVHLTEIDASGQQTFSCQLDGATTFAMPTLGHDRFVMEGSTPCATCFADSPPGIFSYPLKGRSATKAGWVVNQGRPTRTNKAL